MRTLVISLLLCFPNLALADWDSDFNSLKNHPRSYEDPGAICEELSRLKFERQFNSPDIEVIVGVEYSDLKKTIGELDLVVFNHKVQKIIQVTEVKCWKSFKGGLEKARNQRQRFITTLNSNKNLYFETAFGSKQFHEEQFKNFTSFSTIGPKGALQNGFDDELEYDLRELHRLRVEMLRCQDRNECAQPE